MGRELRRKEAKRKRKDLDKKEYQASGDWRKIILTVGIVMLILVVLYLVLAFAVTKEFSNNNNNSDNSEALDAAGNVANPILASAIFSQSEDVYYIYCYDFTDADTNVSNTISNNLLNEKVYRVNTNDSLNSKYVAETGNKDSNNLENLKVSNPTLLKIENGSITMYLEGATNIVDYYN